MYFIGVEGLSAKLSVAALASADGTIRAAARIPFGLSLQAIDREKLITRIQGLIEPLFQQVGYSLIEHPVSRICVGIAGANGRFDRESELPDLLRSGLPLPRHDEILCTGDCEMVLASHTFDLKGSVLLSGMGCRALFGTKDRSISFHGGWGPIFADYGSGFSMGTRVLYSITDEYDRNRPESLLARKVKEHLKNPPGTNAAWQVASSLWEDKCSKPSRTLVLPCRREMLFNFAHEFVRHRDVWEWRNVCSSLVIPLMNAWHGGCLTARRIVLHSARALARCYRDGLRKLKIKNPISPLVLYGGVLRYNERFRQEVLNRIAPPSSLTTILPDDPRVCRPVIGSLLFALGGSSKRLLRLPPSEVLDCVRTEAAGWSELNR